MKSKRTYRDDLRKDASDDVRHLIALPNRQARRLRLHLCGADRNDQLVHEILRFEIVDRGVGRDSL